MAENNSEKGYQVKEWFDRLSPQERMKFQHQLLERWFKWHNAVMPVKKTDIPPIEINTIEDAQRAMLLESYYSILLSLFRGEDSLVSYLTGRGFNILDAEQVRTSKEDIKREYPRFISVVRDGDWRQLKKKWQQELWEPPKPPLKERVLGVLRNDSADRLYSIMKRYSEDKKRYYDLDVTRKVIQLVPDKTQPIDPASIDPDSPLVPNYSSHSLQKSLPTNL